MDGEPAEAAAEAGPRRGPPPHKPGGGKPFRKKPFAKPFKRKS
jgi:hypothetical protein